MADIRLSCVVSEDLKLDESYILNLAKTSANRYSTYLINKKNGRKRIICHPSPELKTLQYWVSRNILSLFPVSNNSFAYKKGKSIKDHAGVHAKSNFTLHLDIENFFENIKKHHLNGLINSNLNIPYIGQFFESHNSHKSQNEQFIENICLRHGKICIGAVSSPSVSNAVMFEFDNWAVDYCSKKSLTYSRYADDLYISSDAYIDPAISNEFETQLKKHSFALNHSKTRYMSRKGQRKITGLVITPDHKVGVGLKLRCEIRSLVYKKMTKQEGDSKRILGYLAYLQQIEPDAFNKIISKYSKYGDVIETIKQPQIQKA